MTTAIQDITGATITATPTVPEVWFAIAIFDVDITTAGVSTFEGTIDFDAVVSGGAHFQLNTSVGRATVTITYVKTGVTAASHTIKMRGKKTAASSVQVVKSTHSRITLLRLVA